MLLEDGSIEVNFATESPRYFCKNRYNHPIIFKAEKIQKSEAQSLSKHVRPIEHLFFCDSTGIQFYYPNGIAR